MIHVTRGDQEGQLYTQRTPMYRAAKGHESPWKSYKVPQEKKYHVLFWSPFLVQSTMSNAYCVNRFSREEGLAWLQMDLEASSLS